MNYEINLPMYFVIRIHEAYPESTKFITEKNGSHVGKFLYDGAVKNPESVIRKRLYTQWRDICCPDYKAFLKEYGITEDVVSENALPRIAAPVF